uniref:Thioredoxin domain-containing protein n=1 Tax=Globodera pallida TaxID=36090 RepID=A0A183BSU3_GLOPA
MSLAVKASKSLAEQPRLIQQRSYSAHPGADGIENASSASVAGGALLSYAPVPLPKMGGRNARQQLDIQNLANEAHLVASLKNGTEFDAVGKISEDEIRKSLLVEAKRRKFWNAKTIDKMDFQEIIQCFCHHYVLESFTETRSVAEAIESSSSVVRNTNEDNTAPLMSPSHATNNRTLFATLTEQSATTRNGPVELKTMGMSNKDLGQYPWDFDVQPDDDFVSQTKILEMPNSHRLGACHSCKGETLVHCFHCRGSGNDKCTYCRGTGMKAGVAHPAVYTHPMIGTFPGTSVAGASAQSKARLRQMSARELLALAKRRDPYGRPTCMLTLFYAPDCVFSAKVADTFFRLAPLLPKLRVVAVDVSVGGKGTESLISHYGISSTPVIALWQDGFPRYRLYDDYARLDTLLRVLRSHTDLSPLTPSSLDEEEGKNEKQPDDGGIGERVGVEADNRALGGENQFSWEPTRDEFLAQFYYLREHLGFDWYLLAAVVTCLVNLVYFTFSSRKGRSLLRRHFPHHFAVFQ